MNRRPLLTSLLAILGIAIASLIGTLASGNKPELGLDLKGGASVTLRPVGTYTPEALNEIPNIYRARVDGLGVAEPEILRQGDTIVVNMPGVADTEEAVRLIGTTGKVLFRPVLSQQFLGTPIDPTKIGTGGLAVNPIDQSTVSVVQVTTPGTVVGPAIAVGEPTSVVQVPGTDAAATAGTDAPATSAAGAPRTPHQASTTTTEPAKAVTTSAAPAATATTVASDTTEAPASTDATDSSAVATGDSTPETTAGSTAPSTTVDPNAPTTTLPPFDASVLVTPAEQDLPESSVFLPSQDGLILYQLGPAFAYGERAIESATARIDQSNGGWLVELNLKNNDEGIGAWNQMASICYSGANGGPTDRCAGGMAFVLDHQVVSAPVPSVTNFSANGITITGRFDETESKRLEQVLAYGASPVEMKVEAKEKVSATLGKDSLSAAVIAGLIGIGLVLLFMLAYYRLMALVVVAGLCVSAMLLWSVISLLSKTNGLALTLAGVTGIIVSVGVTVDSYVVFFERLKDEAQSGKTFRSSAQRSFKSAWRTILAADTVSFIGALILWKLTVGSVKGFAFFLGLSTLCDLIVSYFFTRPAVLLLARSGRFANNKSLLGVEAPVAAGGAL